MCTVYNSGCDVCFLFFKQKTAYEMRISDWSSDVCSSDLEYLLHLLANNRVERGLVACISLERRIAPGLTHRALQHLLRIHLPAIVECPHQDEIGRAQV